MAKISTSRVFTPSTLTPIKNVFFYTFGVEKRSENWLGGEILLHQP
jgi:hypothetical protein